MFNLEPEKKWVFHHSSIKNIKKIEGIDYESGTPVDRFIEMSVHAEHAEHAEYIDYAFYEERNLTRLYDKDGEKFCSMTKDFYKLLSVIFIPKIYSPEWLSLNYLASGDMRGIAERVAVNNLFHYCFWSDFDSPSITLSGRWKTKNKENPLPVFFPEIWERWAKVHETI